MASALSISLLVLGACLDQVCTAELPVENSRTRCREDPAMFYEFWPTLELLGGTAPIASKPTDVALHDADLGVDAWRDIVYPVQGEREFRAESLSLACRRFWWLCFAAASCYLLAIFLGTRLMKSRDAYHLKGPLALWNFFLAAFSIIGMVRTVPHLSLLLYSYGFEYTVCRAAVPSCGNGAVGFWIFAFVLSKYVELIDTLFLVLRKKPVKFLHWYHHCTVLMYCWHSYFFENPTGIYFVAMNYSVHAVMYSYYFLAALCSKPPRWGTWVTVLQLVQMAGGIFVTVRHLQILLSRAVPNCDGHLPNLVCALSMYASYFVLFAQFFARRYLSPKRSVEKPKGKTMQSTKKD